MVKYWLFGSKVLWSVLYLWREIFHQSDSLRSHISGETYIEVRQFPNELIDTDMSQNNFFQHARTHTHILMHTRTFAHSIRYNNAVDHIRLVPQFKPLHACIWNEFNLPRFRSLMPFSLLCKNAKFTYNTFSIYWLNHIFGVYNCSV